MERVGFIGLGNVGAKLARSLLRNGVELDVFDLDSARVDALVESGARSATDAASMMRSCEVVITCLPTPQASAEVVGQFLPAIRTGKVWIEMSTTDQREVERLGAGVVAAGGAAADCPVSGGCHRAATGNIAIFAGCERATFERLLPLLTKMGREILHTGPLGSASMLKVLTNFLATVHLLANAEALVTAKAAGVDLATAFEAIRISSGNSFSHETESQLILNGSRDIEFTMDLVKKDVDLFQTIADRCGVPLELSPLVAEIVDDGIERYGPRELSPNIIRRLEEATGIDVRAPGFPAMLVDHEPEAIGAEVLPRGRAPTSTH